MKQLIKFIFKQYDIGKWWGAFRNTVSNSTMYITFFNTAMLVPMAYVTWVQPWTAEYLGIQITFGIFCLFIFICGIFLLLFEYKIFTPSTFSFWNNQWWKHNNPIKIRMDKQDEKIKEQNEIIKEMSEAIKRIEEKINTT